MITVAAPAEFSVATQVHEISQAAYALEAERIGCADFPPLRETLDDLRQSSDRFLVFQQRGRIVGALSFDRSAAAVTITRLVVIPECHRRGVATALLAAMEERVGPVEHFKVTTAQNNQPAVLLYQRFGYTAAGTSMSPEGILLMDLVKQPSRHSRPARR